MSKQTDSKPMNTTPLKSNATPFQSLVLVALLSIAGVLYASTPNPGHPWREIGDGIWAATGTTAYRTFTFPDASSTILTTNALVTVAQGGTGQNSTSSAMNALSGLAVKGDLSVHNGSIHTRLPVGTNNYVLTADGAQANGVKWAPPVASPSGNDTEVQFNDAGTMGSASALTYNSASNTLGLDGKINLTAQPDPSSPPADTFNLYAKSVSGRTMLKGVGPRGVDYAYQPSFFQNVIMLINTGGTTALNFIGNNVTSVGTISHVNSEDGYFANFVTGATAGNRAGTGSNTTPFYRGSQVGSNGFFFQTRLQFPDATSTGLRAVVGFTSGTMTAAAASDNPTGSHIAWQYSTSRGDTGWKFMTRDGTTQTVTSTILPMASGDVFDFFIYCPPYPNNSTIYYRIDNLSQGTTAEGSTSATLPAGNTALRAGFQISNVLAGATNVRMSRLYVETDR